jgi:hypothetical protein
MNKLRVFVLRIDDTTAQQLHALAEREDRSQAAMIRFLVREAAKKLTQVEAKHAQEDGSE